MTFASVSSQGALLRPCSPSSGRTSRPVTSSRSHILHFHFKDPSAASQPPFGSYITLAQTPNSGHSTCGAYYTSQLLLPQLQQRILCDSFRAGIPRSSSGFYPATARPVPAVVLHPVSFARPPLPLPTSRPLPPPPQSILVLPGSARTRIRLHQAREEAAVRRKTVTNPAELSNSISAESKTMAATAVHLSSPPPSATSTPHHIHHHIAPAGYHNYSGFYTQQNDHGSPTVIVTDSVSHIHPAEHFTPSRVTPIGYPGGAHGHNPVVIRVVQKPIESLMVDGDNPFRPDGDLYKEADEVIKVYTLPRGSKSPSPMPGPSSASSVVEVNSQSPHLDNAHEHDQSATQVKDGRSTTVTSTASSSSPSSVSVTKEEYPGQDENKENHGRDVVERPRAKSNTSAVEEDRPREQPTSAHDKPRDVVIKKKDKKKRKPVGCGGDKRCSIM